MAPAMIGSLAAKRRRTVSGPEGSSTKMDASGDQEYLVVAGLMGTCSSARRELYRHIGLRFSPAL